MQTVLFVDTHDAGRSQMATALFNLIADRHKAVAISAGTEPAGCLHSETIQVMRELGMDISATRPRRLTSEMIHEAGLVVTLSCPATGFALLDRAHLTWNITDLKGQSVERIREIRDQIRVLVMSLVTVEEWSS